jgi:hypothetical protein
MPRAPTGKIADRSVTVQSSQKQKHSKKISARAPESMRRCRVHAKNGQKSRFFLKQRVDSLLVFGIVPAPLLPGDSG